MGSELEYVASQPIRGVVLGDCASAASGARTLMARTTASPIRRIRTSVAMAGGSLADEDCWILAGSGGFRRTPRGTAPAAAVVDMTSTVVVTFKTIEASRDYA